MSETAQREAIARLARSIFERGLTCGSSGNISVRLEDGWLMTPTGTSMGELDPARLSRLDAEGRLVSGDAPTKESFLHLAMYEQRPSAGAVVHLHSTHSVAVSCLADVDPANVLPPVTAYYVMRIGVLPLVPRGGEERVRCEVPSEARVALHVCHRVQLDEERNERHEAQHGHRQPVDRNAPGDAGFSDGEPLDAEEGVAAAQQVGEHVPEQHEAQRDGGNRHEGALAWKKSANDGDNEESGGAEGRNYPRPVGTYGVG